MRVEDSLRSKDCGGKSHLRFTTHPAAELASTQLYTSSGFGQAQNSHPASGGSDDQEEDDDDEEEEEDDDDDDDDDDEDEDEDEDDGDNDVNDYDDGDDDLVIVVLTRRHASIRWRLNRPGAVWSISDAGMDKQNMVRAFLIREW